MDEGLVRWMNRQVLLGNAALVENKYWEVKYQSLFNFSLKGQIICSLKSIAWGQKWWQETNWRFRIIHFCEMNKKYTKTSNACLKIN